MAELVVVVERPVGHLRCLGVRPLTARAGSWELGGVEDEQIWVELVWLLVPSATSRDPAPAPSPCWERGHKPGTWS